jgi:YD repeat-containing protein
MNFNQTIPIKNTVYDTKITKIPYEETINQQIPKISTYRAKLNNEIKPETLPLENRDLKNVGSKEIKSYQYEHPEIKPYYQEEANILKGELERTKSGNDVTYKRDTQGYLTGVERSGRITSQSIGEIKDATKASYEEINKAFKDNQNESINFTMDPIVSSDIIDSRLGALVDGLLTSILEVDGKQMVKVVAWYDNEMGYSAQMVRTAEYLGKLL